ncbi:MAG: hypothetical protein F4Y02_11325 [Chloroflexi bacterium]|nr:hypothetical protein [Chloroflexota bacterium]
MSTDVPAQLADAVADPVQAFVGDVDQPVPEYGPGPEADPQVLGVGGLNRFRKVVGERDLGGCVRFVDAGEILVV